MKNNILSHDEIFTLKGFRFRVRFEDDNDSGPPWTHSDGHGEVSDWTHRDKLPGELVLCEDHGAKRFYDFAGAVKIAFRDGWGAKGDEGMTRHQKAAQAARSDFEYLRRWCADLWNYMGVVVERLDAHGEAQETESLWDIESEAEEYLSETARELANSIAVQLRRDAAKRGNRNRRERLEREFWAARGVVTK